MAATTTDEVRVIVVAGRCDYTNYVQASNKFGNSKIGMSRLQTAFKTTSTMLEHHDQKIINTLNSDQPTPLCVFSRSVKHAGLPSAKITDFSVKISDDELKAGNNTQQLISSI